MTGQTVRQLGDYVRGSWGNEKQVGAVGQLNVPRSPIFFFVEETGRNRIL